MEKTCLLDLERIVRTEMACLDAAVFFVKFVDGLGDARLINHQVIIFAVV